MGQRIEVRPTIVGNTAIFDTDRSITGQDGTSYGSADDAANDLRFPGRLAARLFAADEGVDSVWIASNTIVINRTEDWSDEAGESAAGTIASFFLYYG